MMLLVSTLLLPGQRRHAHRNNDRQYCRHSCSRNNNNNNIITIRMWVKRMRMMLIWLDYRIGSQTPPNTPCWRVILRRPVRDNRSMILVSNNDHHTHASNSNSNRVVTTKNNPNTNVTETIIPTTTRMLRPSTAGNIRDDAISGGIATSAVDVRYNLNDGTNKNNSNTYDYDYNNTSNNATTPTYLSRHMLEEHSRKSKRCCNSNNDNQSKRNTTTHASIRIHNRNSNSNSNSNSKISSMLFDQPIHVVVCLR